MISDKELWIGEAVAYMELLELQLGEQDAHQLAESLFEGAISLGGVGMTPQEAVDEELTYWGD